MNKILTEWNNFIKEQVDLDASIIVHNPPPSSLKEYEALYAQEKAAGKLSADSIVYLLANKGFLEIFNVKKFKYAVWVVLGESSGRTKMISKTYDYGIWQLNQVRIKYSKAWQDLKEKFALRRKEMEEKFKNDPKRQKKELAFYDKEIEKSLKYSSGPIEFISYDDAYDPDIATEYVKKVILYNRSNNRPDFYSWALDYEKSKQPIANKAVDNYLRAVKPNLQ